MIDIHAHILPGVDDGASDMGEAVRMARIAVESGVTTVIVTPHYDVPGTSAPPLNVLRDEILRLQEALKENHIPLKLYSGMEIFGTPDTAERLCSGALTSLAGSRYILIEFPFYEFGRQATRILRSVLQVGAVPVVAHPERYVYAQEDPELMNLWFDMGCLLQINRGSLVGRFGQESCEFAESLLDRRFVSFVASDAHGAELRTPWLTDAQELLRSRYGQTRAKTLLEDLPAAVLANKEIRLDEPEWF
ncbi:MAG: hypothetical protein MJ118_08535 [Clostridia bacterium]|nr:hypothetical protein [Clostridia bacterium]